MIDVRKLTEISRQATGPGAPLAAALEMISNAPAPGGRSYAAPSRPDPTPDLVAASLAGGMIAGLGRRVTAEEAVAVWREVREAMG